MPHERERNREIAKTIVKLIVKKADPNSRLHKFAKKADKGFKKEDKLLKKGEEEATKSVEEVTKSAEERAKEIHSALDPRAQRARTTAVTETKEGVRVVSSSEPR